MQSLPLSSSAFDTGRAAEAHVVAERAGGRTILRRQHVGYPLHVTRGFYLDAARPDVLTLYIQSASGGLYAGDRLTLDVDVGTEAALHLTTQAATVVHHGRGGRSMQQLRIRVGPRAFCAISSDPYVLFPGANLALDATAVVGEDAVLVLVDGLAVHDPRCSGHGFAEYVTQQRVMRPDGRLLLLDRGRLAGGQLRNGALGTMAAAASALLVAPRDKLPGILSLTQAADECGCLAGASEAPNQAGLVVRMLAPDGGVLTRGIEAVFQVAARAALGIEAARRRK
ncbi:urease accessory protein UreD [Bradyrhizobium sp. CCBAU 51753]|uniref:urease accessory protein UreD n=1 Tax=Bradyrhizobium sp. CCBAU 51753 TaxID=1325100 RepID=UPI00188B1C1D|nr:urease accessory protein UreD [Bradyrhizobium sp. CCBAU 51753]QOZ24348.1 urease accessory protein UreD [Bradyrhizobium sp. CCBAU 51753]